MPLFSLATVTPTRRRWLATVAGGVMAPLALAYFGVPAAVVVALALTVGAIAIGEEILRHMTQRGEQVRRRVREEADEYALSLAADVLATPTHGNLTPASEVLGKLAENVDDPHVRDVFVRARAYLDALEKEIVESQDARDGQRAGGAQVAGAAASSLADERTDGKMDLYQADATIPSWIRRPRLREVLRRVGAVLDDVRALHDSEIEWSVLLFTMWARLVLVGSVALLPGLTSGTAPLADGLRATDIPWLLAFGTSALTAVGAPWVATTVMRRDDRGRRVRRVLLWIEAPIAVAAIVLTPSWLVASFAAGWTNWWQRPVFDWIKLVVWIAAVAGCLTAGLALADASTSAIAAETVVTFAVIGVIGGSYGAMLPISATVLLRVMLGELVTKRRARIVAEERLNAAVHSLVEAADAVRRQAAPGDALAARRADSLESTANKLAIRSDAGRRWRRGVPRELDELLQAGLTAAAFRFGHAKGTVEIALADAAGEEQPLTVLDPAFPTPGLGERRLADKDHARALALFVTEVVREAARYGTRPMTTTCVMEGDRVRLRFANAIRSGPVARGRASGEARLTAMVAEIPGGTLDRREEVTGTFVDLPEQTRRFGVQISFPVALLERPEEHR